MADFNVGDDSFTLFALGVLIADIMFVKVLKFFGVRDHFPVRVFVLSASANSGNGLFSLFAKGNYQV
jgi:hypothetical protein